ncbi:MAG: flagellar basal body rod protein FlgC [Pseudomonadales bacterium]|nr:flagellar basal body rod protein FlgC [Pseudomonadales bacterium]MCP5320815.1 flagellar basal body rod protein FlgC [Pseudomonadales bacterium]MCP5337614.1 flagellar basal body rod protein FlgC [Pseudomonadales bacterium]
MSINAIFDVAGSAMSAQSIRLNTVASNLANAQTASSSTGQTYRARHPVFAPLYRELTGSVANEAQAGVQVLGIVESDAPLQPRYEPDHPLADARGYVYYPNVNVVEEMADMISASRSFQINVQLVDAAKTLAQRVLALGQ